jgi:hypothetical protein
MLLFINSLPFVNKLMTLLPCSDEANFSHWCVDRHKDDQHMANGPQRIVATLVKKSTASYGTRSFVTV